jgi:uncharacterized membrane protein YqjE
MSVTFPHGQTGHKIAISDLVRELFSKMSEFVSKQIELVKAEVRVESRKLSKMAIFGVAALAMGAMFVLLLGASLILLFAQGMSLLWATILTTIVFLILAGGCVALMINEAKKNYAAEDIDD